MRRTAAEGRAEVLGPPFAGDDHWVHWLVRAEVDLDAGMLRFYRLRRRAPRDLPLITEMVHRIRSKTFQE